MSATRLGFKSQLLVTLALYIGLFLVEYPPIFLMGYWSWGAVVHKSLTGVLIVLNLLITQRLARRLGLFRAVPEADGERDGQRVPTI